MAKFLERIHRVIWDVKIKFTRITAQSKPDLYRVRDTCCWAGRLILTQSQQQQRRRWRRVVFSNLLAFVNARHSSLLNDIKSQEYLRLVTYTLVQRDLSLLKANLAAAAAATKWRPTMYVHSIATYCSWTSRRRWEGTRGGVGCWEIRRRRLRAGKVDTDKEGALLLRQTECGE